MSKTVLIFSRDNCAPCKHLKDMVAMNQAWIKNNTLDINWVDTDKASTNDYVLNLMTQYNVRSAPTIVLIPYEDSNEFTTYKTFMELVAAVNEFKA